MIAAVLEPAVAWEIFSADPRAVLAWGPGARRASERRCGRRWLPRDRPLVVRERLPSRELARRPRCPSSRSRTADAPARPDGVARHPDHALPSRAMRRSSTSGTSAGSAGTGSDAFTVRRPVRAGTGTRRGATTRPSAGATRRRSTASRSRQPLRLRLRRGGDGHRPRQLEAFMELARDKTPRGARRALRENARHPGAGRAGGGAASLGAGVAPDALAARDLAEVSAHGVLTLDQRMTIRLAADLRHPPGQGRRGHRLPGRRRQRHLHRQPFERRFRDIHAVTQQLQGRQAHFETVGQFLLGLDPDTQFL